LECLPQDGTFETLLCQIIELAYIFCILRDFPHAVGVLGFPRARFLHVGEAQMQRTSSVFTDGKAVLDWLQVTGGGSLHLVN